MLAKPEKLYLEILFFIVGLVLGAWASVAQAQENSGATILKIAGKAEILSQGQRLPAHEGFRLSPGQSIQLVGGGEVRLSTNGGKVQVRVLADTTVKYDGEVDANGQPWGPSSKLREVSTGGSGQMAPQISVPVGKLEIQVEPGQELRVVCPLIMAAVRGTRFNISVELDGSSTVTTLEGRVATYGRNGELRLISSGQSAQVTARAYSNFLANQGVSVPRGSWREAPAQTQAAVDDRTLGNIFGPDGGGLLAAVLANPDASPTDGVNALAIEATSVESGSIFVESPLEASSFSEPAASQDFAAEGSAGLPESSLLAQGLPDTNIEKLPPATKPIAHFIGNFNLPATPFNNNLAFDLDLTTGWITNAEFKFEYKTTAGINPLLMGHYGSGQVDLSSLSFLISGFEGIFIDNNYCSWATCVIGNLGPNTHMSGNFGGSLDFSQTGTGSLSLDYAYAVGSLVTNLQSSYTFVGDLNHKAVVDVRGTFDLSAVTPLSVGRNYFMLNLDLNNGVIRTGLIRIEYNDSSNNFHRYHIGGGSGSVTGDSFNISFTDGRYYPPSLPETALTSSSLDGHFDSSSLDVGTQVLTGPGNQLNIGYPGPIPTNGLPTTVPIQDGEVIKNDNYNFDMHMTP